MGRVFRPRGRTILPLLLSLLAGCSRPGGIHSAETQQTAPFHEGEESDPRPELSTASEEVTTAESSVPFHDGESLPVGTLLTVRLTDAINWQSPGANTTFVALVDEPIVIEGATIVPRGASVAGRIESGRSSTMPHTRGYVRLTLDQMDIAGRDLPIRTSSLFARANAPVPHDHQLSSVVSLEQGRRLTFRLSEAVPVITQPSDPVTKP